MKIFRLRTDQNTPDWSEPITTETGSERPRAPAHLRTGVPMEVVADVQAIVDRLVCQETIEFMRDLEGKDFNPYTASITPEQIGFPTISLGSSSDRDEKTTPSTPQPKAGAADDVVRVEPAWRIPSGISRLAAIVRSSVKKISTRTLGRLGNFHEWYGM